VRRKFTPHPNPPPSKGIGARLRAQQRWEKVYLPSPLVGEGENEGKAQAYPHLHADHVAGAEVLQYAREGKSLEEWWDSSWTDSPPSGWS
jgi:hypothetical protein